MKIRVGTLRFAHPCNSDTFVIPAKAGIQSGEGLDPGSRRGDDKWGRGDDLALHPVAG